MAEAFEDLTKPSRWCPSATSHGGSRVGRRPRRGPPGKRQRAAASPGLLLFLAWKAFGENGLSLLLLLLAVAVGVGFQIPNRANLAGFRDEIMRQEVSSGLGHVRVRPRQGERFIDVADMLASIARLPSVKAVEPILVLPGAIKKGGHLVVLGVTGVNAAASQHPYERTAGADLAPGDDHGALLGERLAKKLGVKVGDEVDVQVLLSSRPRLVLDDGGMGNYTLTVRGLVGFAALDSVFVDWRFLASETGDELLHLLGALDRPAAGTVAIEGVNPWTIGRNARAALCLRRIGFVFQQSNLMPFLSARDNVALPAWRLGGDRRAALAQADRLLARFGLAARIAAPGGVLSLGEAQRVATARALVNRPAIILADEPTGSLDSAATEAVLDSFDEIVLQGTALLVATHDARVASRMHRIVRMEDGRLLLTWRGRCPWQRFARAFKSHRIERPRPPF